MTRWIRFRQPTAAQLHTLTAYVNRNSRYKVNQREYVSWPEETEQGSSQVLSECYIEVQFIRGCHRPTFDEGGAFSVL